MLYWTQKIGHFLGSVQKWNSLKNSIRAYSLSKLLRLTNKYTLLFLVYSDNSLKDICLFLYYLLYSLDYNNHSL